MMWEHIRDVALGKASPCQQAARGKAGASSEGDCEAPGLTLGQEVGALVELWGGRAELARGTGVEDNAFSFTLRGGIWT
eukprot:14335931-Alexandrium_andersonii.AAC.1